MISPSNFAIFVSTANTMIGQAYSVTANTYPRYCSTVPSGGQQNIYAWTGMLPKPRVWEGPRVVHQPAPQTYTLVNLPYEETVAVDRFVLDDDMLGVYYRLLPDLARQTKRLPDLWTRDLIENAGSFTGTRQNGLDGLTHWNTAHNVDIYDTSKGTYANDFTGGGLTKNGILVGGALSPTGFKTLREYMRTFKAEDNEPLAVLPDLLMVSPLLETEASLILKSMFFAPPAWGTITGQVGAADNPLARFGVDYMVNPLLTNSPKTWYLLDTTKAFKPFIWQVREQPVMVPRVNENDPNVFDNHMYQWGMWGRGAPGWSYAWLSTRSGP